MKKYAVCGVSNRAVTMYIGPICKSFSDVATLVGLLDKDPLRFRICEGNVPECKGTPAYRENEFEKMVDETKPDAIIVAGADHTHARYVIAALKRGLDVICEKPMTSTAADAKAILEAEAENDGQVIVTFNYRYPAAHRRIKELILEGRIGRVTHADLNWYIDTYHGASYFKRWNRNRALSGGLSIHKSSHHFDLLQWWLDQEPVEVFAYGDRNYYGADAPENPRKVDGRHCTTCPDRTSCRYVMRWQSRHNPAQNLPKDDHLGKMKLGKEPGAYTDYSPDMCIFDSEIDIEDMYVVTIKYDQGAVASYSCNWSCPYEGYRLGINGTEGRMETQEYHAGARMPFDVPKQTLEVMPLFGGGKETVHILHGSGGHGGGDPLILEDLFIGPDPKRAYDIQATARSGALAVATGEAVWKSVAAGQPIKISELLD